MNTEAKFQWFILYVIVAIAVLAITREVIGHNVRWCSNPRCKMCNRLQAEHDALHPHPHIDSTPYVVVNGMLQILKPTKHEVLYDIGCGDARFLIAAAKNYGCKGVGIEISPERVRFARNKVREAGLEDRITIIEGDARKQDLSKADIIVMHLFPDLMSELQPAMFSANRIASYSHRIPDVPNKRWYVKSKDGTIYYFYMWHAKRKHVVGGIK